MDLLPLLELGSDDDGESLDLSERSLTDDDDDNSVLLDDAALLDDSRSLDDSNPGSDDTWGLHDLPEVVQQLRKSLLGGYCLPENPPDVSGAPKALDKSQQLSLEHWIAWSTSKGTVKAYNLHAGVLEKASGVKILSLYAVKRLAQELVDLKPKYVDICRSSCIAYTGAYKNLTTCPYIHNKNPCGKARYRTPAGSSRQIPHAQAMILPIMPTLKALYANATTSCLLCHRDSILKQALLLLATASGKRIYSDFGDLLVHSMHHTKMGLFGDP